MNKQIEKKCQDCFHYEVCRFVNALAVANVVHAENCRMFKDTKSYRKSTDVAREIFAEIEKLFHQRFSDEVDGEYRINAQEFTELKKKYESEGADDE